MRKMRGKIITIICLLIAAVMLFAACNSGGKPDSDVSGGNSATTPSDDKNNGGNKEPDDANKPAEPKVLSAQALAEALKSTPYKQNVRGEEVYGLTDPQAVGADEKAFSAVKYPVPADSECKVISAADNGVTTASPDNTAAFNKIITSLRYEEGAKKIKLENGTYRFSSPLKIANVSELYICGGENTRFVMNNWVTAFSIANCDKLHINDISIDYDPSPNISGTIVSCDTAQMRVTIKPDDEFDLSLPIYGGGKFTQGSYLEYEYDELTMAYKPDADGNLKYNDMITYKAYDFGSDTLTLGFDSMRAVKAGTRVAVAFTMYNNPAVSTTDSSNVYFENFDVISAPGMAFYNISNRNMYFNRSDVRLDPDSKRLMTASADGIHCKDSTGNLQITGCILEASHDDSINICNFYKTVTSAAGNTIICDGTAGFDFPLTRNSTIDIYRPDDYGFVASYKVTQVAVQGLTYTLTVDGDASAVKAGYLVGNATRVPKVLIENNIFRNKRNRGILAQFRSSKICNNAFINVVHGALMMHSVWDVFHEAIVPRDIEVSGNKFVGNNACGGNGEVQVFVYGSAYKTVSGTITGIEVSGNYFAESAYSGVFMRGVGQSTVAGNMFYNVAERGGGQTLSSITLITSDNITVQNNYTLLTKNRDGFKFLYEYDTKQITDLTNPITVG